MLGESVFDNDNNVSLSVSDPVICKVIAPYKDHTVEEIFNDLRGCIVDFYMRYKYLAPDYTIQMAMSDSFMGVLKAIEACKESYADSEGYAIRYDTNEPIIQTKKIVDENGNTVVVKSKAKKTVFATFVYRYICGAIQQGMKPYQSQKTSVEYLMNGNTRHRRVVSLDSISSDDESSDSLSDTISEESRIVFGRVRRREDISEEQKAMLGKALHTLSAREIAIISDIYNIGEDGKNIENLLIPDKDQDFMITDKKSLATQTTVASKLNISKQRVCNIHKVAIDKLREYLTINKFNEI